jgi:hypothetical protein
MVVGFTLVAMQTCSSPYITVDRVGLFGVSPTVSNAIHCGGAFIGFGSMIFWIMLCFRKSDKKRSQQTEQKRLRNTVYFWLAIAMIASLLIFAIKTVGLLSEGFPVVFVAEAIMLLFGGISCLIKGELFLADNKSS